MIQKNMNSLPIWFFENLLRYREICHFVSTRSGGFSPLPYNSLNLGFHVGDDPQKVLKNRELLASTFGFSINNLVTSEQVHRGNVAVVTEKNHYLGATDYKSVIKATDAMITNTREICLMVLLADCSPILFYDPKQKAIGVAHAGWSGTVNRIVGNTVNAMIKKYSSTPKDIIVGIGPTIGPCCYEVRLDVVEKVQKNLGNNKEIIIARNNKYYLNLWKANKMQLLSSGIAEENIEVAEICTKCNESVFFSARANKGGTGRFGVGIMMLRD
jgi:YfiH family protein